MRNRVNYVKYYGTEGVLNNSMSYHTLFMIFLLIIMM